MAKAYPEEAVEKARELYLKYGGRNFEAIEREMRRAGWEGWRKSILFPRGKGSNYRPGWIDKRGFENSLKLHLQKLTEQVNDDEQDLYLGIKTVRKNLQQQVVGQEPSKDALSQYATYCKLEIDARRNLDLSRDNLDTFVAAYEKLVTWLTDLDKEAAKHLIKHGDKLADLAQAHYGTAQEVNDGAIAGTDAGGQ